MTVTPSPSPRIAEAAPLRPWHQDPGIGILLLAGLLFWLAGYPRPHVDDLFFTGASIELARGGGLTNHYLAVWSRSFSTDRFLYLPPVLPFTLAAWTVAWGVSAASFTAFHVTIQTALEIALYRLARQAGASLVGGLAVALVAWLFCYDYGMRPDPLAMLLVVLGQCVARSPRAWRQAAGAFLSAAAVLCHPLVAAFVLPLHVAALFRQKQRGEAIQPLLLSTVAGVVVAFGLFMLAINGDLTLFVQTLATHRKLVSPAPWYQGPEIFFAQVTFAKEPLLLGPLFGLAFFGLLRSFRSSVRTTLSTNLRWLWWTWLAVVVLGLLLYPGRSVRYMAYSGLALAIVSFVSSRWSPLVIAGAIATASLHNAAALLEPVFGDGSRPDAAAVRAAIARHPEKIVCLDEVVARYVFDFRTPPGAIDWFWRQPAGMGNGGTLAAKPAGELWLVNEWKLEHHAADAGVCAERLRVGPFTFHSVPQARYRIRIIE